MADQAHTADAVSGEADSVAERQPEQPVGQEPPRQEEAPWSSQPISLFELTLQAEEVRQSDLTLPAPGLPDEPTFTGDPVAYVEQAAVREPVIDAPLTPKPDAEAQSDPEFFTTDDAVQAQPLQVEAAVGAISEEPEAEPTEQVVSTTRDADATSASDVPSAEPTAVAEVVADGRAQEGPFTEQVSTEPISIEEEPTVPIARTRGEAPWPEQTLAELPTIDEPTSDSPAALEPAPEAPLAEQAEAEPTSVEEKEPAAQIETLPEAEPTIESPWPEHASDELPTLDEPPLTPAERPIERQAEQPLRDRIPSVLPVELEAIKAPLEVPVFDAPARPPEAARPIDATASHAPEVAFAASGAAAAIPQRAEVFDEVAPSRPSLRDLTPYLRRALRLAVLTLAALGCLVLALIVLYRWVNPPASTLMLGQWLTGTRIDQRWVPLNRISPYLQRAVITSEDGQFCRHHGVDWGEIEEAIERARDGIPRGGSTISMQVVKNLFLWPSKSYVRKAMEFPLTFAIEMAWSKPRILEIYLNIAEWGPGVFGAEAAARYHFGKSAATLTPSQAALLAVSLPNPIERRAGAPGSGTLRLATTIHARMMASPGNASCVQARR